jgi:copper homeostasis protein (lipoprotein)
MRSLWLLLVTTLSSSPLLAEEFPFEGTYWKLTLLNGSAVTPGRKSREAHLVFQSEGRVAGYDGCNRLFGSYTREGDTIRFEKMGGTLVACLEAVRDREFREALSKAAKCRIAGPRLELRSGEDEVLAQFEAVPKN